MSLAILPGSYDPMTLGHLDIVKQAAAQYEEVVVAVMINPEKKVMFDMDMRVKIAACTVKELNNVRVLSDTGMLVDLYRRLGADVVCKGYRNDADYAYEMKMAEWNAAHEPTFRTVLMKAEGEHAQLSSTEVRKRLKSGASLEGLLHPDVIEMLKNR